MSAAKYRVAVAGASGRMGQAMLAGLPKEEDIEVVGGFSGRDAAEADRVLAKADVMIEFTNLDTAPDLILRAIKAGVRPVSGTSGMPDETLQGIDAAAREKGIGAVWAAPMRIGGALLIHLSKIAARFYETVEIVEAHHAGKADAPSGTALVLTTLLKEAHGGDMKDWPVEKFTIDGVRGGVRNGIRVHSIRTPGLMGRHEIMFSAPQEVLTIRYEEGGRDEYAASAAIAIRKVMEPGRVGLVRGMDSILGLEA